MSSPQFVLLAVVILASTSSFAENMPMPRGEAIRKGDFLMTRVGVDFADGKKTRELEASSFEAFSSKPVIDKCHFEIVKSENKFRGSSEQSFPPQVLESVKLRTDVPDFEMIGFLEQLRPSAEIIFNQIVDIDDLGGPVYKSEDMKDRLRTAFQEAPYKTLPKSTLANIEQSMMMHLQGYWSEVEKVRKKPIPEVKGLMADYRARWLTKMSENIREQLRQESKGKTQRMKSDQMTRTVVQLNFNFKEAKAGSVQSKLECIFEGDKSTLNLDRLNAVLNPYFEMVPKHRQALEDQAARMEETKRGIAVEGQPISN